MTPPVLSLQEIERLNGPYAPQLDTTGRIAMLRRVIGTLRLGALPSLSERKKIDYQCAVMEAQRIAQLDSLDRNTLINALSRQLAALLAQRDGKS